MSANPRSLGDHNKCKHGKPEGLCTRCNYLNTGRRESTDSFVESDVVKFMGASINKRMKEIE